MVYSGRDFYPRAVSPLERASVVATFNYIRVFWKNGTGVVSAAPDGMIETIERVLSSPTLAGGEDLVRVLVDSVSGLTFAILKSPKAALGESSRRDSRRGSFVHVIVMDREGTEPPSEKAAQCLYESLYGTPLNEVAARKERDFIFLDLPSDPELVTALFASNEAVEAALGLGASVDAEPDRAPIEFSAAPAQPSDDVADPSSGGTLELDTLHLGSLLTYRGPDSLIAEAETASARNDAQHEAAGLEVADPEVRPLHLGSLLRYRSACPVSDPELPDEVSAHVPKIALVPPPSPEVEEAEPKEAVAAASDEDLDGEAVREGPPARSSLAVFGRVSNRLAILAVGLAAGVVLGISAFNRTSERVDGGELGAYSEELRSYTEKITLYEQQLAELEAQRNRQAEALSDARAAALEARVQGAPTSPAALSAPVIDEEPAAAEQMVADGNEQPARAAEDLVEIAEPPKLEAAAVVAKVETQVAPEVPEELATAEPTPEALTPALVVLGQGPPEEAASVVQPVTTALVAESAATAHVSAAALTDAGSHSSAIPTAAWDVEPEPSSRPEAGTASVAASADAEQELVSPIESEVASIDASDAQIQEPAGDDPRRDQDKASRRKRKRKRAELLGQMQTYR